MAYRDPLDPRNREARLRHYYANKAQYMARSKQVRQEMRVWVAEYKAHPCIDCGNSYPHYVMDLHHRDPSQKIDEVSKLVLRGNWGLLISEAEKLTSSAQIVIGFAPIKQAEKRWLSRTASKTVP